MNNLKMLLFLLVFLMFGCQKSPEQNLNTDLSTQENLTSITPLPTPIITPTQIPTSMIIPTPTKVPTPTATLLPIQTASPVPAVIVKDSCPTLVEPGNSPMLGGGSILFGTGAISPSSGFAHPLNPERPGVWAVSDNNSPPQLVYDIPSDQNSFALVSPGGKWLLSFRLEPGNSMQQVAIFFNIEEGQEYSLFIPESSLIAFEWLAGGRFKYIAEAEYLEGLGLIQSGWILDPQTQQSEPFTEEFALPDFNFLLDYVERLIPAGYASLDPTGELILYTASINGRDDMVRLMVRETGEIIWEEESIRLSIGVEPEWSADGSRVLFIVEVPRELGQGSYDRIISLTRDGEVEELPTQPLPRVTSRAIDNLTRSLDSRYILYRLGDNKGFVLDTETWELGEICQTGTSFIDGFWLSSELFVYRVSLEEDGEVIHSLRLLDIPGWTTQIFFESGSGYGINIFGWTPIEFSN